MPQDSVQRLVRARVGGIQAAPCRLPGTRAEDADLRGGSVERVLDSAFPDSRVSNETPYGRAGSVSSSDSVAGCRL